MIVEHATAAGVATACLLVYIYHALSRKNLR